VFYTTIPASKDEIPRIPPEELKGMIDNGEPVVIVDCNPETIYQAEHIPGALNLPWDFQGLKETPELPKDILIVAYCVCAEEEDSGDLALEMIRYFGYRNIKLLLGGNPKWRDLGYPMEKVE